jgi:hypothetical protein
MKLLDTLLTTAATGYFAFKGVNYLLMHRFFKATTLRMKLMQTPLNDRTVIDPRLKRNDVEGVHMRVLYSEQGMIGWHMPLITREALGEQYSSKRLANSVINIDKEGLLVQETIA